MHWFERGKRTVRFGDPDFVWNVRIWTRLRGRADDGSGDHPVLHALWTVLRCCRFGAAQTFSLLPVPCVLGRFGGRLALFQAPLGIFKLHLSVVLRLLKLHRRGLVHTQLGHGCHHFASYFLDPGLELVHALGKVQCILAAVRGLGPKLVTEGSDLFQNKLLF